MMQKLIPNDDYPTVEGIFQFIGMESEDFWDFLSNSDVTWGSEGTLTLIDSNLLFDMVQEYIEEEPDDEDNETYIERLKLYKQQHNYDYHVIE